MKTTFWIIEWQDISGDEDHDIKEVAVSAAEAAQVVRRILARQIVTDELKIAADGDFPPEAEQPAFDFLFAGEDPVRALAELEGSLEQECDDGKIIVTRTQAG
jgi:hypothetical protein